PLYTHCMSMPRIGAVLLATMLAVAPAPALAAPKIIEIPTRDGVVVRVLLVAPTGPPSGTVLLFPGSWGARHFSSGEQGVRLGTNFLVRTAPLFAEQGLLAAVIDTPSDQPGGMTDDWRLGPQHVT